MPRRLDIIPILHTEADLGDVADALRAQLGERAWSERQAMISQFWERIARWCDELGNAARGLVIFQDGLPIGPAAERIVHDLAARGSHNHALLARLLERGATLVGTEDPDLLVREYALARRAAEATRAGLRPDPRHEAQAGALLKRRDAFIAQRIGDALPEGGRGVLFIGMLHNVEPMLAPDIEVVRPIAPLAEGRSRAG